MSFLGSLFLFALPLVAIPVILHLLKRRQKKVVEWGAMIFLAPEVVRSRRMKRVDDLILMILRTIAIAAIILAIAQPLVSNSLFGLGNTKRETILILDTSLSTDQKVGNSSLFDLIQEQSEKVLNELDDGSLVQLMVAGNKPQWLTQTAVRLDDQTRQELTKMIQQWKPTLASADLGSAILTALAKAPDVNSVSKSIILLTDQASHGWQAQSSTLWRNIHTQLDQAGIPTFVNVYQVGEPVDGQSYKNLSVEKIETLRTSVSLDEPLVLSAVVKNRSTETINGATLEWSANGESQGISTIPTLGPDESVSVDFDFVPIQSGVIRILCESPYPDSLVLDNQSEYVLNVVDQIPLLIVAPETQLNPPRDDLRFVLTALGQSETTRELGQWSSVFHPEMISYEELEQTNLDKYSCVMLLDAPVVSESVVQELTTYVRSGRGLWIVLGNSTDIDSFNATFHRQGTGLSIIAAQELHNELGMETEPVLVVPPEDQHTALEIVGDLERLDLEQIRIEKYFRLNKTLDLPEQSILLQTAEGDPLAIEHYLGRGRVIVQALPFDLEWSNLPICRVNVALIQEWLHYLAQPSASQFNLERGDAFRYRIASKLTSESVTLRNPLDHQLPPNLIHKEDSTRIHFAKTDWPGAYVLDFEDEKQLDIPFYVQRNQDESDLTPLLNEARNRLEEVGGINFVQDPLQKPERYETAIAAETPLWFHLLITALVCLIAELIFTCFVAKRRYTRPATV